MSYSVMSFTLYLKRINYMNYLLDVGVKELSMVHYFLSNPVPFFPLRCMQRVWGSQGSLFAEYTGQSLNNHCSCFPNFCLGDVMLCIVAFVFINCLSSVMFVFICRILSGIILYCLFVWLILFTVQSFLSGPVSFQSGSGGVMNEMWSF